MPRRQTHRCARLPPCPPPPPLKQVPAIESPLLGLLGLTMGMSWHDVCDGGRMTRDYLERHPAGLPPPLPGAQTLSLVEEEAEGATEAAAQGPAPSGAPPAAPAFNPATLSALVSLLPPGGLPGLQATLAGLAPAAAAAGAAAPTPPADSSGCSEDTVGDVALTGAASSGADVAQGAAAASAGASLASTGTSRKPTGGPALPPRRRARSAAA
jgi:hypothetical protein